MRSGKERFKAALGALLFVLLAGAVASAADAEADITRLLHGMFDKPDAVLEVAPVVIAGDFAIADWTQGEMGGRALLRRKQAVWEITLCAGDAIKSADAMRRAGVPATEAAALERDLATAEGNTDAARAAMFSRFEGMVMMTGPAAEPSHGDARRPK